MKTNKTCKGLFAFLIFLQSGFLSAQSLEHPVIWTTSGEREDILNLIENNDWARSLVDGVREIIDDRTKNNQANPALILSSIPKIAEDDDIKELDVTTVHDHARVLAYASYAGLLYYLTEEEPYAQFAADIIWYYAEELAPREPHNTSICGNTFYDPRTSYAQFAIAYDFIYNFLKQKGTKVYSATTQKYRPYDHSLMQKAISNMAGNVLQEYGHPDEHGKFVSNHPILTAPGALFTILCIEDDEERERLFDIFWEKGTAHQNSFKHTILPMFGKQGIWPESTSYSFMPTVTMILNIVDRLRPEMNVMQENMHILDGNFLFDNLRMPDRRFVTYGDSHRDKDQTSALYRYTLNLAQRRNFSKYEKLATIALSQGYKARGGYNPGADISTFGNFSVFTRLLWGSPIPEAVEGELDFQKPTVVIEHAGIALQRNYVADNNELYGLCGVIGGAHYVHSHLTGIGMELYGAGYVMAPSAGLPPSVAQRRIPLHEHYFRLYAGNNTVIVNGTSHGLDGGSWKGRAHVWQNTVVNIAAEPGHLEDPISGNFSFAIQFLKDEVNNAEQQRTLSTIRTSPTTAYYFDMFRSKSLDENKFHDYIYHNLGDTTMITIAEGKQPELNSTDRYHNDIGDVVHSPGWKFFENTEVTKSISDAVNIRYDINYDNKYMHQLVPGGVEREYTLALAPPSRDVRNGYTQKKTQVLAIRQQREAWDRPFISVFEPSVNKKSSVRSIEALTDDSKVVGAKVVSKTGDAMITDYIICQDTPDARYANKDLGLSFSGRFGIVRIQETVQKRMASLYIGEGTDLIFGEFRLEANGEKRAFGAFEK